MYFKFLGRRLAQLKYSDDSDMHTKEKQNLCLKVTPFPENLVKTTESESLQEF